MQKNAATFLFLLLLFMGSAISLNAQQTDPQAQQNLLPEIDPQDIEIRSQFQARFPGLRRQPILGFNPKPRVFQINPNRTPFIESEEAIAASVPVGQLDRPDAPTYTPLSYVDPATGFARLGIGTYVTPEADIYAIKGFGNKHWVSGNLSHRSSNGHLDEFDSSFRDLNATIRAQLRLSKSALLKLNSGVFSAFNYLPADQVGGTPLQQAGARSSRTGGNFGGSLAFNRTSVTGFQSDFNFYSHQFDVSNPGGQTSEGTPSEWGVTVDGIYSWAGSRTEEVFSAYANIDAGSIDVIGYESSGWSVTQAGARYERLLNYQTDIDASFGVALVSDASNESKFYIAPKLDARHTLLDGIDLRARISGSPNYNSLLDLQTINRFIGLSTPLSHQYTSELRSEVIIEPLSGTMFTGGIQFQHIRNHTYFTRNQITDAQDITTRYSYSPQFENANFFKVYASFSQQLAAEKFWVSADAYWQRPRLSGNDKIPYTESLGLTGTASVRPVRDLVVEGWVDYSGSRFNPVGNDLDPYFLLGARFELALAGNAGIYAKLLNINDVDYEIWQGYRERGFQAYVGITYLF
ncbi:hypothetical protein [Rhodohalobacter sp. 8-1]|uniref:hypothetical protein n=1 Tax=Rhodohalobacter sp. 8-1 TaxID=3131972 RepID=UPI0030EE66D5